jgi:hypothetical protein
MPLPQEYNQAVVTHINGMEALEFLKFLVRDEGPLAGQFQQSEQRLNAYVFSTPLLVIAQVLSPLPDFDELHLRFEDGFEVSLNLLGQFTDWSASVYHRVDSMRSTSALEEYMHSNPLFESFMESERDLEAKKPTLWKFASKVLERLMQRKASGIKPRGILKKWIQMTRKHKALLDPVANVLRDNLINITEEEVEQVTTTTEEPPLDDEENYLKSLFARNRPEGYVDRLDRDIKHHLAGGRRRLSRNSGTDLRSVGGMEYSFLNDVVIVRIPTMNLEPRYTGDDVFHVFPDFVQVQAAARERGISLTFLEIKEDTSRPPMRCSGTLWQIRRRYVLRCESG